MSYGADSNTRMAPVENDDHSLNDLLRKEKNKQMELDRECTFEQV